MDLPVVKLKNIQQEILLAYQEKPVKGNEFHPASRFKGRCATFQSTMKITVIVGQFFALNPVLGVSEIDTSKIRFSFYSKRFIYSIISIVGQIGLVVFCLIKLFMDSSLSSNASVVFYTSNCMTTILFLRMATKWPKLCELIARTEAADPNMDIGLVTRCNIACLVILSLAVLEHVLYDVAGLAASIDCEPDVNLYKSFIVRSFPWIYTFLPYNHVIGVISQILNIQCTFTWNFANLFVICVSLYLTSRLEQVNKRIVAVKGKYCPSSFWRTMREDYSRVTYLVRLVDDVIGGVVFISFSNNLFFICVQLLHTLADGIRRASPCHPDAINKRPFQGYEPPVYFAFSFGFLVIRSLAVSLIASQVHTASREPAYALYVVPSATYCIEVQRFLNQIHGETVALSGLQFFHVKRGIILAIAGTIVTYELVLLQFTGVTPTSSTPT